MKDPNTRPRLVAGALLVLALLLGTATGVALDRLVLRPDVALSGEAPRAERGERHDGRGSRERYHAQLARELGLSAEQEARVDSILQRQQEKLRQLDRDLRPQYKVIFEETRAEIDAVLSPEQRERLAQLRAEWKQRKQQRERERESAPRSGT